MVGITDTGTKKLRMRAQEEIVFAHPPTLPSFGFKFNWLYSMQSSERALASLRLVFHTEGVVSVTVHGV